jgi:hypothetical protein
MHWLALINLMWLMYDLRLTICYCKFGTKGGDWAMVEIPMMAFKCNTQHQWTNLGFKSFRKAIECKGFPN